MTEVSRRNLLKTGVCLLGSAALDPIALTKKVFAWGAIKNVCETHQFIVKSAINVLRQQPIMKYVRFPSGEDIAAKDWVIKIPFEKGPGPDVTGASNFSDHYYNPHISAGKGPIAVRRNFIKLIEELTTGRDCSKSAAWAAHFISDMNVPYHVIGMPKHDAQRALSSGNTILNERITGPHHLYFGNATLKKTKQKYNLFDIPSGWGYKNNFEEALRYLCKHYKSDSQVDWFDPWYFNGFGIDSLAGVNDVLLGSHAVWEYLTYFNWNTQVANQTWAKVVGKQVYFDKKWENQQVDLFSRTWGIQGNAAGRYAVNVAFRTKDIIQDLWANPHLGVCLAVQSVLTLFRASMTAIRLKIGQHAMGNNLFRIKCDIINTDYSEAVENVYLALLEKMENGDWRYVSNTSGGKIQIPPGQTGQREFYGIKIRPGTTAEFKVEVSGLFKGIPDLGYTKQYISISNNQFQPDPVQPVEPKPTSPSQNPEYCGIWKVKRTCTNETNLNNKKEWLGKTYTRNWTLYPYNGGKTIKVSESGNGRTYVEFKKPGSSGSNFSISHTIQRDGGSMLRKDTITLSVTENSFTGTWTLDFFYKSSGKKRNSRTYSMKGVSKIKSYN